MLLYAVMLVLLYVQLPSVDQPIIALMFVAAGMANGGYQQIPFAMYPDLMDQTREQSGHEIEGAFSALWLFGQKAGNALAPLLLGVFLQAFGWQASVGGAFVDQTPAALEALRWGVSLIPAAIMALAVLGLVAFYKPEGRA